MKRGRDSELQDTCNSKRKRVSTRRMPPRRAPVPDFWSPARQRLLLQEIIKARSFRGQYRAFPLWDDGCSKMLLQILEIHDAEFKSIRHTDLMAQIKNIRNRTSVEFYFAEPPVDEHDQLIYNAFHEEVKAAPLGRDERSTRNSGQQRAAGVTVNLQTQRTSSHTTNIGSSSGSFSNATEGARERSNFLMDYMDDLNEKDISAYPRLLIGGNMGVIQAHNARLEHEAFINAMVEYSRALNL